MRVMVTGGSGFIGSHVVERLVANGHEPRIYDLVPPRSPCARMVEAVVGDICDVACVRRALRGCDAIVHLAAVADVNDAARDPSHADLVNARGTALLLQAAREAGVARIIYASTIWVYGNGAPTELLDEDALLPAPDHFYTATKLAGEMYCRCLRAAVRPRADDPPLRDPARAPLARGDGRRDVRGRARSTGSRSGSWETGPRRASSCTSRTWPRASCPRSCRMPPAAPTTSSATRP